MRAAVSTHTPRCSTRPARDPGRGQLAGARLPRGRRHAAHPPPRRRRLPVGRRGPPLHRLHRLLGPDDPGPRPSGRAGGRAQGCARRPELRRAHRTRGGAGRGNHPPGAQRRAGAAGQQRHRGRHERDRPARGATGRSKIIKFEGCYHGHADAPAGQGRFGPGHLRLPDQRRRAGRGGAAHAGARIQQRRSAEEAFATHGAELACG